MDSERETPAPTLEEALALHNRRHPDQALTLLTNEETQEILAKIARGEGTFLWKGQEYKAERP